MGRKITINGTVVDLDEIARSQKDKAPEANISRQYSFNGDVLNIEDVACSEVNIQPHRSDNIEVVVSGPQSAVESVDVARRDGEVYVTGSKDSTMNINGVNVNFGCNGGTIGTQINSGNAVVHNVISGSVIHGSFVGGSTIINSNGGNINIVTEGKAPLVRLDIKVPVGADVDYNGNSGKIQIGDTEGGVYADLAGDTRLSVGSIKSLELDAAGAATADIKCVNGHVKIDGAGSSEITIHEGNIAELDVDLAGAGKVTVYGTAQRAKLDISGMGKIYVQRVIKNPRQHRSGMGSISIGKIG